MSYDPATYWAKRGRTFEAEYAGRPAPEDDQLARILMGRPYVSVLEVGCGFGRVGEMVAELLPGVPYTGLDISRALVKAARRRLPRAEIIRTDLVQWDSPRRWDLVLAVQVLGCILPADVAEVIAKLRRWATYDLVTVDWDETGLETDYQFAHDYRALLPDAVRIPLDDRVSMYRVSLP